MSERECLLELFACCAALAEVGERLAQARAGKGFATDRTGLAAECGGFEQVRACCLGISGQELDFAQQGRTEGLAAQRAAGARVLAEAKRELGKAPVRFAGVEHVLGDAGVDVEHAPVHVVERRGAIGRASRC